MTEKIEISDKAIQAISSAGERIIGYLFSGLFVAAVLAVERHAELKSFVETTGGVLALVIAFTLGIGIFTIYSRIFGELLLFPLQHAVHIFWDWTFGLQGKRRSATIGYLIDLGVPWPRAREAYCLIRDEFLSPEKRALLEVEHGELHVLYLTGVLSLATYAGIGILGDTNPSEAYLYAGIGALVAALISDGRQHSKECRALVKRETELKQFLRDKCFAMDDGRDTVNA